MSSGSSLFDDQANGVPAVAACAVCDLLIEWRRRPFSEKIGGVSARIVANAITPPGEIVSENSFASSTSTSTLASAKSSGRAHVGGNGGPARHFSLKRPADEPEEFKQPDHCQSGLLPGLLQTADSIRHLTLPQLLAYIAENIRTRPYYSRTQMGRATAEQYWNQFALCDTMAEAGRLRAELDQYVSIAAKSYSGAGDDPVAAYRGALEQLLDVCIESIGRWLDVYANKKRKMSLGMSQSQVGGFYPQHVCKILDAVKKFQRSHLLCVRYTAAEKNPLQRMFYLLKRAGWVGFTPSSLAQVLRAVTPEQVGANNCASLLDSMLSKHLDVGKGLGKHAVEENGSTTSSAATASKAGTHDVDGHGRSRDSSRSAVARIAARDLDGRTQLLHVIAQRLYTFEAGARLQIWESCWRYAFAIISEACAVFLGGIDDESEYTVFADSYAAPGGREHLVTQLAYSMRQAYSLVDMFEDQFKTRHNGSQEHQVARVHDAIEERPSVERTQERQQYQKSTTSFVPPQGHDQRFHLQPPNVRHFDGDDRFRTDSEVHVSSGTSSSCAPLASSSSRTQHANMRAVAESHVWTVVSWCDAIVADAPRLSLRIAAEITSVMRQIRKTTCDIPRRLMVLLVETCRSELKLPSESEAAAISDHPNSNSSTTTTEDMHHQDAASENEGSDHRLRKERAQRETMIPSLPKPTVAEQGQMQLCKPKTDVERFLVVLQYCAHHGTGNNLCVEMRSILQRFQTRPSQHDIGLLAGGGQLLNLPRLIQLSWAASVIAAAVLGGGGGNAGFSQPLSQPGVGEWRISCDRFGHILGPVHDQRPLCFGHDENESRGIRLRGSGLEAPRANSNGNIHIGGSQKMNINDNGEDTVSLLIEDIYWLHQRQIAPLLSASGSGGYEKMQYREDRPMSTTNAFCSSTLTLGTTETECFTERQAQEHSRGPTAASKRCHGDEREPPHQLRERGKGKFFYYGQHDDDESRRPNLPPRDKVQLVHVEMFLGLEPSPWMVEDVEGILQDIVTASNLQTRVCSNLTAYLRETFGKDGAAMVEIREEYSVRRGLAPVDIMILARRGRRNHRSVEGRPGEGSGVNDYGMLVEVDGPHHFFQVAQMRKRSSGAVRAYTHLEDVDPHVRRVSVENAVQTYSGATLLRHFLLATCNSSCCAKSNGVYHVRHHALHDDLQVMKLGLRTGRLAAPSSKPNEESGVVIIHR